MQPDIKIFHAQTNQQTAQPPRGVVQPLHDQAAAPKAQTPIIDNPLQQFEFDNDATVGTPEAVVAPAETHHRVTIGIAVSMSVLFLTGTLAAYLLL